MEFLVLSEDEIRDDNIIQYKVSAETHNLINNSNSLIDRINRKSNTLLEVELAFMFHLYFIKIHPFHDGNFRTARVLNNLLMVFLQLL